MKNEFDKLIIDINVAATTAAKSCKPKPMSVCGHIITEGACGFAWVNIPGRGKFAKYAKEFLGASKTYSGPGFDIWYSNIYKSHTSQSYDRHMAACEAAAKILNEYGIKAVARGRLD